jgi:hypothetical protein
MQFKRYIIQFISTDGHGDYYHCVGLPKDTADISNAQLMSERALKVAIENNCYRSVYQAPSKQEKVQIPHRVLEVNCTVNS